MSNRYDQPEEVAAGGDRIQFSKHLGALMCIRPLETTYKEFGKKGDDKEEDQKKEKTFTVIADVDIIEGGYLPESKKMQGQRLTGVWISGAVLAKSLAKSIDKEVLGRVAEGAKGNSPQPPVILEPHTPEDVALADAFYAAVDKGEEPKSEAKETAAPVGDPLANSELSPEMQAKIAALLAGEG